MGLLYLVGFVIIVVTGISAWIARIQMRRRIKQTLGTNIKNDIQLTSLNTWMEVKDAEEKNSGGRTG